MLLQFTTGLVAGLVIGVFVEWAVDWRAWRHLSWARRPEPSGAVEARDRQAGDSSTEPPAA